MPFGDEPVAVVEYVGAVLSEEAYRHCRGRVGRSDENGLGHLWRRGIVSVGRLVGVDHAVARPGVAHGVT